MPALTKERLDELFAIDAGRGSVIWKKPPLHHADLVGREAGTRSRYGYTQIRIDGRLYRRSRLIWFYVHGCWPAIEIDHENLAKADDRVDNLRDATHGQNMCNTPRYRNNRSGAKGIDWRPAKKRWRARIAIAGKRTSLGHYESLPDAIAAREAALVNHHGAFARAA